MANNIETFLAYFLVGGLCLVVIYVMVILPIILTKQYYKGQGTIGNKHIRFNTSFGSFYWEDGVEAGYEGEVEWEQNPGGGMVCGLFFETDEPVTPPTEGYEKYALSKLRSSDDTDLDIEKLIHVIPRLAEIRPGKCYSKLESILLNKERIDTEIREYVADYFLFKPDLIEENVSREELMYSMNLSFISVYRNGVIRYSIFDPGSIYVDDLEVVVNEDGSKKVEYSV